MIDMLFKFNVKFIFQTKYIVASPDLPEGITLKEEGVNNVKFHL